MKSKWSEAVIGKGLAHGLFSNRSVLVVPNCGWPGSECDLLVVDKSLRLIDVEIKISRADLLADVKKDKWWQSRPWRGGESQGRDALAWPRGVWKHYYALPMEIFDRRLLAGIPEASGVLTLAIDSRFKAGMNVVVRRHAKPNPKAEPISRSDTIDIARLAGLRMWQALAKLPV